MEDSPTNTWRKWLLASTSVSIFLLVTVVGGVFAGLPLPLFSRSSAQQYKGAESIPMEAVMPGVAVGTTSSINGVCQPNDVPYLGITYLVITDALARFYGLESARGLLVTDVDRNSPAARVGILPKDILLSFDGQPITPDSSLVFMLMQHQIGDSVTLTVSRHNELREVRVTLGKPPGS